MRESDTRRARSRALKGHSSQRYKAAEYHADKDGTAQSHGLRYCKTAERGDCHHDGQSYRNGLLYQPGAGERKDDRRKKRPLLSRRHDVRNVDRRAALQRGEPGFRRSHAGERESGPAEGDKSRDTDGTTADNRKRHGKISGREISERKGNARRPHDSSERPQSNF